MNNIKVLDVTLRDGGCVNNFDFGQETMEEILLAQEKAHIDIIELGYIDEVKGSICGRTQFNNVQSISAHLLHKKRDGISYVVMMDYGKFSVENLHLRTVESIDGVRLAFHKKDREKALETARSIIEKGYDVYLQPMLTLRYSDIELLEFINLVNCKFEKLSGFYLVDSFGEMRNEEIVRYVHLINNNLNKEIPIGLHSHNNLQLSYSNAMTFMKQAIARDLILDSSIMGMGKGAGNLNTELLLEHLNIYYQKEYNLFPLIEVTDKIIKPLYNEYQWGYSIEFYLSSIYACTPSYASHFYEKYIISIEQIGEILKSIPSDKKNSFDKNYADAAYIEYKARRVVKDDDVVMFFSDLLENKEIAFIAPGKSVGNALELIQNSDKNVTKIGLNLPKAYPVDYSFITRQDILEKTIDFIENPIISSNVNTDISKYIINYSSWIEKEIEFRDAATVMAFQFFVKCGVKSFHLYGFDGYSNDRTDNYFNPRMKYSLTSSEVNRRNLFYKDYFRKLRQGGLDIKFETASLYEEEND